MNTDYFDALKKQVNAANTCAQISQLEAKITAEIGAMQTEINSKIAALQALMVAPSANFTSIINWINNVIATYTAPYNVYIAQLATISAKLAEIQNAISSKKSSLGCS